MQEIVKEIRDVLSEVKYPALRRVSLRWIWCRI